MARVRSASARKDLFVPNNGDVEQVERPLKSGDDEQPDMNGEAFSPIKTQIGSGRLIGGIFCGERRNLGGKAK